MTGLVRSVEILLPYLQTYSSNSNKIIEMQQFISNYKLWRSNCCAKVNPNYGNDKEKSWIIDKHLCIIGLDELTAHGQYDGSERTHFGV